MQEPDERTRLLSQTGEEPVPQGQTNDHDNYSQDEPNQKDVIDFPRKNVLYCALVLFISFVLATGSILMSVPMNAILETNICRRLHPELDLPDASYCEGDTTVQEELALVRGWQTTVELLPGVLVALPYGMLADKYGRKPMMIICLFGIHLYAAAMAVVCWWPYAFPVRMLWLSPIFLFIGGGVAVLTSLLFSMLADLVPGTYRASMFSALGAGSLVAFLFASSIASVLMEPNPWLPFLIGQAHYPTAVILAFFLPETGQKKADDAAARAGEQDGQHRREDEEQLPADGTAKGVLSRFRCSTVRVWSELSSFAWENPKVILLGLTLLTTTFGKTVRDVLQQYAKHRFHWPWYRVGFLLSYEAAIELVLLLVIVPTVNYFMVTRWSLGSKKKDIFIVRVSTTCTVLGTLAMAVVTTKVLFLTGLGVYSLGSANNLMMRSLLAQLVQERHHAILFTSLAVAEELSSVAAGPVLAVCLRASYHMEGILSGLPFFVAALFSLVTLVTVFSLRI